MVNGYFYLPADGGAPILFAKKPAGLGAEDFNGAIEVEYAAKPELMPGALARKGRALPKRLLFEDEQIPCAEGARLAKVFPEALMLPGSALMRRARSAKTSYEIGLLRISGERMSKIFESLPALYRPGMTDLELSIALEREMRLSGDLAVIRSHGRHLEIPPGGSLLAGDNAAAPSPYDFAIGGAGLDPTVPVGANGAPLLEGQCLLVDLAGNFTGYMIDMSRAYSIGEPPEDALRAHAAALGIQRAVALAAKPGAVCGDLYDMAMSIAAKSGYSKYFMGHAQQSRFIGHGVGLDLDELPVIALNSKSALEPGMAIALEPKFTLPGIGAVGTENTFLVTPDGLKALCAGNDEITRLPPPARG
jgi:Xaa-Pro aminopeptidase